VVQAIICLSEMFEDRQRRFLVSFQPVDTKNESDPILFTSSERVSRKERERVPNLSHLAPSRTDIVITRVSTDEPVPRFERTSTPPVNRRIRVTIGSKQQASLSSSKKPKSSGGVYVPSGRVYVMGFYSVDFSVAVNKYLDKIAHGKKVKPLVQFFKKLGVELPRQPDLLFPAAEVIQHATHVSCGENSIVIVGMVLVLVLE